MRDLVISACVCVALLTVGSIDVAGAQTRQVSLEMTPFHGTIGYGRVKARTVTGFELGFGFPEFDRTLEPSDHDLLDFFHLGAFVRSRPTKSVLFDGRIQLGGGELDGCSGCFPGLMLAVSGGVFVGSKRVKVGPRISAGWITEHGEAGSASGFVVNLRPVAVMLQYVW